MKYIFFGMLLNIFTASCNSNSPESPLDQAANQVTFRTTQRLKEKYNFSIMAFGGKAGTGKITELNVGFDSSLILDKEGYRKLILECAELFLEEINNDIILKEFLEHHPFTLADIWISIFFRKEDGSDLYYPQISVISLAKNRISYATHYKEDRYKVTYEEESIQEALKKISHT